MPRVAILSDSHDQIANLRAAVDWCGSNDIDLIIHCGDLISPFMLAELAVFNGDVHLIYGNNGGDRHLISSRCGTVFTNITHHGELASFTIFGRKFGVVHSPETARGLATLGTYDIVCCGHSHEQVIEQLPTTLLINPGHLLGENEQTGFTVLDCTTLETQRIHVDGCMFDRNPPVTPHAKKGPTLLIKDLF